MFKFNHPERRDGEIFLGNLLTQNFGSVGYSYKRLGDFAYNKEGKVVRGMKPLFVLSDEARIGFESANPESLAELDAFDAFGDP